MSHQALSCSYILLTYNQADTVVEAVQSALSQVCAPMEIVITDDCSKDATFELVQKATENYRGPHRVILNRNDQNLGLAGNITRAHNISSGDIIIVAAGDDVSQPHRSARIVQAFATHQPLLVCSYAQVVGPDGENVAGDFRTAAFYHTTDLDRAARSKSLYIGATGAWHRALFDKYGPLEAGAYEDLVFGFRATLEGKVTVIEEELVRYRLGSGMTSSSLYHTDATAFNAHRRKSFVANSAIMRQRVKDAETFGLPKHSKVWRILKKEEIKAALGQSYYQEGRRNFMRRALMNPLLGIHTWSSERRRKRKVLRLSNKAPSS